MVRARSVCQQYLTGQPINSHSPFGATNRVLSSSGALDSVRVPILAWVGSADNITPPAQTERLAHAMRDWQTVDVRVTIALISLGRVFYAPDIGSAIIGSVVFVFFMVISIFYLLENKIKTTKYFQKIDNKYLSKPVSFFGKNCEFSLILYYAFGSYFLLAIFISAILTSTIPLLSLSPGGEPSAALRLQTAPREAAHAGRTPGRRWGRRGP